MKTGRASPVALAPLAWATALVPLVAMHLCFVLSASEALIDWCLPWFQGCSSISRASREGTAYFVFKGLMLPAVALMGLFWWANRHWLIQQGVETRTWWWLGMLAALLLALYTVVLGHLGDTVSLLRRIGVTGFFGLTFFAQLGLGSALRRGPFPHWGRWLLRLSMFTLAVGLLSVVLGLVWPAHHDRMEDGFEWSLAVLINLHTLMVAWMWQRSGLSVQLSLRE